jgi:ubiquitin-protein ligase
MQSYLQSYSKVNNKEDNISYIINKCCIYTSYKLSLENIEINCKINDKQCTIEILLENKKPILINLINTNSIKTNKLYDELCKKIEKINLNIESYEEIIDILYDINLFVNNKRLLFIENEKENNKTIKITKDEETLIKLIEKFKKEERLKNYKMNGIFSYDSCLEMLGDQLIKINKEINYYLELNTLFDIKIILTNFNINKDINVTVTMKINPEKIMTEAPLITLSSNTIFKYNLLNSIEKLKPFANKENWSIKYSFYETICNIYNMIDKYAEIERNEDNKIMTIINDLEYLFTIKTQNIDDNKLLELFDKELLLNKVLLDDNNNNNNNKNNNPYWKKGTGYGHASSSKWNIDDYVESLKIKRKNINDKMSELLLICNNEKDIEKDIEKYLPLLMELFKSYLADDEVELKNVENICNLIIKFNKHCLSYVKIIKSVKDYLEENGLVIYNLEKILKNQQVILPKDNLSPYQEKFNQFKFRFYDKQFQNLTFIENENKVQNINNIQMNKLQKEFKILKSSIILCDDASIFFMIEKNNINNMRFIISGPKNTPYEFGLFIFNMTIPIEYPNKPPFVRLSNTGYKRFNPNLYDSGKVCLSLLGTWKGDKGESWNSETSTFYQLLLSIQSQIMIDEPYFNEPGHEKYIGTVSGKNSSKDYNENICQYTIDHAMIDLLEKDNYPEFKELIHDYFNYQKENILKTMNKWQNNLPTNKMNTFSNSLKKLEKLLNKPV